MDIKKLTGLSTGNLSELENDKFAPSASALIALKKVLNISIDWLLTGEGEASNNFASEQPVCRENTETCYPTKEKKCLDCLLEKEEQELLSKYRKLDDESKRDILGFIRVALTKSKDRNNTSKDV